MDNNQDDIFYYGTVIVRVTSADGAIPIEGATVAFRIVDGGVPRLTAILETDESGETSPVKIQTPSPLLSMSPDPDSLPYSTVNIEVTADGYYTSANMNVPVFAGITSVQNVNMISLPDGAPEGFVSPNVIVFESEAPEL